MKMNDISDRLNPILVKEVRQIFHSKELLLTMGIILGLQLLLLFIVQLNYIHFENETLKDLGRSIFYIQLVCSLIIPIGILCVITPCYRFNKERMDKALDYSRITILTPFQITSGKLLCTLALMIFIHATSLPFITISYFLRGISIDSIFWTIVAFIPLYLIMSQVALLIGSFGKKGVESLLFLAVVFIVPGIIAWICEMIFSNHSGDNLPVLCLAEGMAVLFWWELFALTVAVVTRSMANIMFLPRLSILASFVVFPLIALAVWNYIGTGSSLGNDDFAILLGLWMIAQLVMLLFCIVFERVEPGFRVMLERPKGTFRRLFSFFFASGKAGGLALTWIIVLACVWAILPFTDMDEAYGMFGVASYFLFYAHMTVILELCFKRMSYGVAFMIVFLVLFIAPLLLRGAAGIMDSHWNDAAMLWVTTPFFLSELDGMKLFWVPFCMAIASGLPLIPFILRSAGKYMWYEMENETENKANSNETLGNAPEKQGNGEM